MLRSLYALLVWLVLFFASVPAFAQSLAVDFRQAANNDQPYSLGDVHWINSIVQNSNSVYYEGMSVPQRLMLVEIPATTGNRHRLSFTHQATKGGFHAYDFLTSYDQALNAANAIVGPNVLVNLNVCGAEMGPPTSMAATCASVHAGPYSYQVDIPDAMGTALGHNVDARIAAYEARFGNRTITLYGDAPITAAALIFHGYTAGSNLSASYSLEWTSASGSILVEAAAHLAVGEDVARAGTGIGYGNGLGAGSISGGPYHVKLDKLDGGSLGSQDNQIMGGMVLVPLACDIFGPSDVCVGTQYSYTFNTSVTGLMYSWALSNNTSGASIVGAANGQSVIVNPGSTQGGYILTVTVSDGIQTAACPYPVAVNGIAVDVAAGTIACNGGNTTVIVSASNGTPPYSGVGTFSVPAGTHTFTVTDANNCSGSETILISEPLLLDINVQSTPILCYGGTSSVTVAAAGGTPPYAGTGTFDRPAGTHTFSVTDAHGCVATTVVTLTQPAAALSVSAAPTPIACNGGTSTVTVTASGGTPPYSGVGVFPRPAGSYSFLVTDANGCIASSATITITQPSAALSAAAVATPILCSGGTSTVTITATGGTPPYSGTGSQTRGAGVYSFTVTDANGCTATTTPLTITEPATLVATAIAPPIACNGGSSTITVAASGGTPPYIGTGTFSRGPGTYAFTVTDANGCSVTTASTTLVNPPTLTLTVLATPIRCHGGNSVVTVSASGGTPPYKGTGTFNRVAGTYTFHVTDANGCTAVSGAIAITEPATALTAAATASAIQCSHGLSTVTVTAAGGTPPYSGTGTFARTAGTYIFAVTDALGCIVQAPPVTITQPPALSIDVHATPILCSGGTSTVTVTARGGTPPYTGTGTFSRGPGTYAFTVTDANGCTATSAATTLTAPAALAVSVSATPILCFGDQANVTVSASGGTPPYTGAGVYQRGAGTYSFTVTDGNGCTASSAAITITQPASALTVSAHATKIRCYGGTSVVTVSASGGTPPYTGTGSYTRTAGGYTFAVTDANGCTAASALVKITEPAAALTVTVSGTPVPCGGGNSTLTVLASGGTPPYTGTGIFSVGPGTHSFTVRDANGCAASSGPITITASPALQVQVAATPIACNGGSSTVTVTATGGTPPYSGTGTFTRNAGTYTFTVTDANGCSVTSAATTLTQPAGLSVAVNAPPISCHGGSTSVTVTATGGTAPYTGIGTFTRGAGTYSFTVTDANGCSATSANLTITQPANAITVTATASPILCGGGSSTVTVRATGGVPPYTGIGNFTRGAGTYTFTVTDANGCSAVSAPVTITNPPAIAIGVQATPILCSGDLSTVTVTATGGTPPYTGTGTFLRGPGTYTFTVTDANGCIATSAATTLTSPTKLGVTVTAAPILCNGGNTTVTVTASGGTPPYSGTGTFPYGAGTYTFTVTDANGCSAVSSAITIIDPPVLTAASSAGPILCSGGYATVTVTAAGGTPPYTGVGTFSVNAGSHTFTVADAHGCIALTSVTLTEPAPLTVSANAPPVICGTDSTVVTVTASGGTPPYSGAGTFRRPIGSHSFTVIDANGCSAIAQISVTGPPPLNAAANATPIICHGDLSTISVTAWGGTPPYTGIGIFALGAGTHTFVVTDAGNCTDSVVVSITEPPALLVTAIASPIVCNGDSAQVTVTAAGGTPPYSGTGVFDRGAGTYTFIVTDGNGCSDSATVTLQDPPPLSVNASASPVLCHDDLSTVTVTASGGVPPYSGTGTFLRHIGTHTISVTDANGCTASIVLTITGPPELSAHANTPVVTCGRDSALITISATGGTPPYSGTGSFFRTSGTYSFIVTDANGCADTIQATVAGPPPLYASAGATTILCHGGTSQVTITAWGGTPPYIGVGTFTYVAGHYTFIVTDANQCSDTIRLSIVEPPPLLLTCVMSECENGMRRLSANVSGGTPPYSYYWAPFGAQTPFVDVPCSWYGVVTLRVRDAHWDPADPNNGACEATCDLQVFSKNAAGQPADAASAEGAYMLFGNYPNPFNPSTTITYSVPEPSHVQLEVINMLGKVIETLEDREVPSGVHSKTWNGRSASGEAVPSGTYIYRVSAASLVSDRQYQSERVMVLLK